MLSSSFALFSSVNISLRYWKWSLLSWHWTASLSSAYLSSEFLFPIFLTLFYGIFYWVWSISWSWLSRGWDPRTRVSSLSYLSWNVERCRFFDVLVYLFPQHLYWRIVSFSSLVNSFHDWSEITEQQNMNIINSHEQNNTNTLINNINYRAIIKWTSHWRSEFRFTQTHDTWTVNRTVTVTVIVRIFQRVTNWSLLQVE